MKAASDPVLITPVSVEVGPMQRTIGLSIRGAVESLSRHAAALDDVDFDVRMGAVNVLVGENGAGKSTLMKIIAGVEQPTAGEIADRRQAGALRQHRAMRRAHGIGIVFQELNLFPNLSVAENIFMARELTRAGIDIDAQAAASGGAGD